MIKGIIFDFDGVIADTMELHTEIFSTILQRYNKKITKQELEQQYAGIAAPDLFKELLPEKNEEELKKLVKEKKERTQNINDKQIKPIPGSITLIKKLKMKGYKLAIGSSANKEFLEKAVQALNITKEFESIISRNHVTKAKPEPDIFLLAAKQLNLKPEECVVIEDGRSGMIAAKKAGMKCIALVHNKKEEYPTKNKVEKIKEITTTYLEQLEE